MTERYHELDLQKINQLFHANITSAEDAKKLPGDCIHVTKTSDWSYDRIVSFDDYGAVKPNEWRLSYPVLVISFKEPQND